MGFDGLVGFWGGVVLVELADRESRGAVLSLHSVRVVHGAGGATATGHDAGGARSRGGHFS